VIRSVAVLGAGVMGAQIAAHFANAGFQRCSSTSPTRCRAGIEEGARAEPDPAFTPESWQLVNTSSFDEGLPKLKDCDWIVEAVVERLDIKRDLLARVDAVVVLEQSSARTHRGYRSPRLPKGGATTSGVIGSALTSSIRLDTSRCSR
jgi:3-hydroxyacyl-CoA dehydrogenase